MKNEHESDNIMAPVCAWRNKIRNKTGDWVGMDNHVKQHYGRQLNSRHMSRMRGQGYE